METLFKCVVDVMQTYGITMIFDLIEWNNFLKIYGWGSMNVDIPEKWMDYSGNYYYIQWMI